MRIASVQSNQPKQNFTSFQTTKHGAYVLAQTFVEKPELEGLFIQKIAKPLEKTKHANTLFDGYQTGMIENGKKQGIAVVHAHGGDEHVIGLMRHPDYTRFAYYKQTELKPTKYFNDYPLSEIEVAKNVTLDKEAEIEKNIEPYKDKLLSKSAVTRYNNLHKGESVEEKTERLFSKFGVEG